MTKVEWTRNDDGSEGKNLNFADGCERISEGCLNCYISRTMPMLFAGRKFSGPDIGDSLPVQLYRHRLREPLRTKAPTRWFVNSTGDTFHDDVPTELIAAAFSMMAAAPRHTFILPTKRPARMRTLLNSPQFRDMIAAAAAADPEHIHPGDVTGDYWPIPNLWLGVSTENQKWARNRIPQLLDTPAARRFISAEPLLGPLDLTPWLPSPGHTRGGPYLDWVIYGGETGGTKARPMHPDWIRAVRDQTAAAGVPQHFKQWGDWAPHQPTTWPLGDEWKHPHRHRWVDPHTGTSKPFDAFTGLDNHNHALMHRVGKKTAGRHLDGRIWHQFPPNTTPHTTTEHRLG
ncbi:DUF5131 family protein, partial [Nocardia asiatica]|uniref:DUF5131 family protein n=1 Tax=Nocardia asiatica TaxID=209252 RepID=UPI0006881C29